jgi:LysR family transcriptional regulator (chromosome initiation inhibitor)
VTLNQLFDAVVEGRVRAGRLGRECAAVDGAAAAARRALVNVAPNRVLPIQLYWHCWNLESDVLDALTAAKKPRANPCRMLCQALLPSTLAPA